MAADAAARQDAELAEHEAALVALEAEERDRQQRLAAERRRLSELLDALIRLSRTPPEVMIVRPQAPIDAVHTMMLLRSLVPGLAQQAAALADQRLVGVGVAVKHHHARAGRDARHLEKVERKRRHARVLETHTPLRRPVSE